MRSYLYRQIAVASLAVAAISLAPHMAHAGAIGWAAPVEAFADEGQAVGVAGATLGILGLGAILYFGLTGMIGGIIMACLGGVLMAQSANLTAILFGAGGGGGSILDVLPAPMPALPQLLETARMLGHLALQS